MNRGLIAIVGFSAFAYGLPLVDAEVQITLYPQWSECSPPLSHSTISLGPVANCDETSWGYAQVQPYVLLLTYTDLVSCRLAEIEAILYARNAGGVGGVGAPVAVPDRDIIFEGRLVVGSAEAETQLVHSVSSQLTPITLRFEIPPVASSGFALRIEAHEANDGIVLLPGWVMVDSDSHRWQVKLRAEGECGQAGEPPAWNHAQTFDHECVGVPELAIAIYVDVEAQLLSSSFPSDPILEGTEAVFCRQRIADLKFEVVRAPIVFPGALVADRLCLGAAEALEEFAAHTDGIQADLGILITGRTSGSVIGCAYQGQCATPMARAVVRGIPYGPSTPEGIAQAPQIYHATILLSHELGHVLDARHEWSVPFGVNGGQSPGQTIMAPHIGWNVPAFSPRNADHMASQASTCHGETPLSVEPAQEKDIVSVSVDYVSTGAMDHSGFPVQKALPS